MRESLMTYLPPEHTIDIERAIRRWGYGTHELFLTLREKQFITMKKIHALCLKQILEDEKVVLPDILQQRIVDNVWDRFAEINTLYPEVIPLLENLKRAEYTLGIITDSDSDIVESIIKKHSLWRFFTINIVSSELKAYKPNTLLFEKALEKACCSSKEGIYVGDSELDVKGAKDIGLTTVAVQRDELCDPLINKKPDFWIRNLSELLIIIDKITAM